MVKDFFSIRKQLQGLLESDEVEIVTPLPVECTGVLTICVALSPSPKLMQIQAGPRLRFASCFVKQHCPKTVSSPLHRSHFPPNWREIVPACARRSSPAP